MWRSKSAHAPLAVSSPEQQRGRKKSLVRTVSHLFSTPPRINVSGKPTAARGTGIGVSSAPVAPVPLPSRYSSRSPSPPSPDIRRPSGLGRRESQIDLPAHLAVALNAAAASAPVDDKAGARPLSSPDLLTAPRWWVDATIATPPSEPAPRMSRPPPARRALPPLVYATIAAHTDTADLPALALVCTALVEPVRVALYRRVCLRGGASSVEEAERGRYLVDTLALAPAVARAVRSLSIDASFLPPRVYTPPVVPGAVPVLSPSAGSVMALRAALGRLDVLRELEFAFDWRLVTPAPRTVAFVETLRALTVTNEALEEMDYNALFTLLRNLTRLEHLAFPRLADVAPPPVDSDGEDGEDDAHAQQEILPCLRTLHAPPLLLPFLLASPPAPNSNRTNADAASLSPPHSHRTLDKIMTHVSTTLTSGLRPAALARCLAGVPHVCVSFGRGVDWRSLRKVVGALGGTLGTSVRVLEVEVAGDGEDEDLYALLTPHLRAMHLLHTLRLTHPPPPCPPIISTPASSVYATPTSTLPPSAASSSTSLPTRSASLRAIPPVPPLPRSMSTSAPATPAPQFSPSSAARPVLPKATSLPATPGPASPPHPTSFEVGLARTWARAAPELREVVFLSGAEWHA